MIEGKSIFSSKQIEEIILIAFEAGEIAANFQKSGNFQIMKKPDNSSVTSADIAVSKFIYEKLTQIFPQIPVVCEEGNVRQVGDIFWLIDPIDGTTGFIDGINEFAVNIALVKNKKVVFGLIYAPLFEGGKMIFSNHNNEVILRKKSGETKILKSQKIVRSGFSIVTSPRTKDQDIEKYMQNFHPDFVKNFSVERVASAIKFFYVVENKVDLYLHFRQSMEWDTAAGQVLVELMNGVVKNLTFNQAEFLIGDSLTYKKQDFLNHSFVAFIN